MHELPVTQSILRRALEIARDAGASRVTAIDLVIGSMSSIVDDSVQFYFDILSKETPAEGAQLRFRRESASATCLDCGAVLEARLPLFDRCPECGGTRLVVTGGEEFSIESVDVDVPEQEEQHEDIGT